jgi:hypothetical protein
MAKNKHQIPKMSLSDFGDTEAALVAARLGELKEYVDIAAYLRAFYMVNMGPPEVGDSARLKAWADKLGGVMMEALHRGDAAFFRAISDLIPISKPGDCVAPIDHELIQLKLFRDPVDFGKFVEGFGTEKLPLPYKKRMRAHCDALHRLRVEAFPIWPATIPELHKFVDLLIPCDEKSVRDAVKRLAYPFRKGKLGAPKGRK